MTDRTTCRVTYAGGTPCVGPHYAKGLCQPCYSWSWRNSGRDPEGRRPRRSPGELDALLRAAATATTDECIILTGYARRPVVQNGGRFESAAKGMNASRAVWILAHGDPGDDVLVCHSCNGGSGASGCINIRHLYPGDEERNKLDMVQAGHTLRGRSNNRGEAHPRAILDEEAAREIRRRYVPGRPHHPGNKRALAEEYGVSVKTVESVLRGQSWRHI